jgi:hypothetical protein
MYPAGKRNAIKFTKVKEMSHVHEQRERYATKHKEERHKVAVKIRLNFG